MVKGIIVDGDLNGELFGNLYGRGVSSSELNFGYEYAKSLSDAVVYFFVSSNKDASINECFYRYDNALKMLNDSEYAFGLDYLKSKSVVGSDDFKSKMIEFFDCYQNIKKPRSLMK